MAVMPKTRLTQICLFAFCVATLSLARAEDVKFERLPIADQSPSRPPAEVSLQPRFFEQRIGDQSHSAQPTYEPIPLGETPISGESSPTGETINLDGSIEVKPPPSLADFMGYRYTASGLEWIPGGGDQLGIFSVLLGRYQHSGIQNGIMTGFNFYTFSGPVQRDMSPRAYDFSIGYQIRRQIGPLAFDIAAAVQAASDFNGDASDGIQYPGHGVGFLTIRPELDLVFGVDYLDRADIKLLPVAGMIWKPNSDMRFELVFPRPRAVFQLNDTYRLYFYGELGGGTWAIERPALGNTLATYSDLRACVGLSSMDADGSQSAIEAGYLFDRRLEFTSGAANMPLGDAWMLRLVTMY